MQEKIKALLKEAMLAKQQDKVLVFRGVLSAFTNELVAKGKKPTDQISDAEAIAVLKRASKQRKEAATEFKKGGREDLAEKEESEAKMLEEFLPATMSKNDILKIASAKKESLGINDRGQMGKLMGEIMRELKDKAEGDDVKSVVESLFN